MFQNRSSRASYDERSRFLRSSVAESTVFFSCILLKPMLFGALQQTTAVDTAPGSASDTGIVHGDDATGIVAPPAGVSRRCASRSTSCKNGDFCRSHGPRRRERPILSSTAWSSPILASAPRPKSGLILILSSDHDPLSALVAMPKDIFRPLSGGVPRL